MSDFDITVEHNDYRLMGTLAFADEGPLASRIQLFATTWAAVGDDPGAPPLVEAVLTKPCGAVVGHALVLTQAAPGGDMVLVQGSALRARWLNGNGAIVAEGAVTDEAGVGPFKVSGTTGTLLYAGARGILGTIAIS